MTATRAERATKADGGGPTNFMTKSDTNSTPPQTSREPMEPLKHLAKHEPGDPPSVCGVEVLQDLERRRRDERAENHHATQPHDERSQRDVPDDGHPVIIIDWPRGHRGD